MPKSSTGDVWYHDISWEIFEKRNYCCFTGNIDNITKYSSYLKMYLKYEHMLFHTWHVAKSTNAQTGYSSVAIFSLLLIEYSSIQGKTWDLVHILIVNNVLNIILVFKWIIKSFLLAFELVPDLIINNKRKENMEKVNDVRKSNRWFYL